MSTEAVHKLVLLRHGESVWNVENRFTGWTDVDLSPKGLQEAEKSGVLLKDAGFEFDVAYVSYLKRSIRTLWTVLDKMDRMYLPVVRDWRLNERHYGALQGLNKAETAKLHGEEQVLIWRRSYATPPPVLAPDDERAPANDPKYAKVPKELLPLTESLSDTVDRFMPLWNDTLAPAIRDESKKVLIVAHGNSLRALIKYLDQMSEEAILKLNVPTGVPLVYELDAELKPVRHYYLGDADEIAAAQAAVANQGKAK